jgi:tRNA nucleotidyltransferase (CCA-adding enzyme)
VKPQLDFSENLNAPLFTLLKEVVSALDLEAYIIGGFVRDHLLGRTQKKDNDIVALGSGIEMAQAVQKKLQ